MLLTVTSTLVPVAGQVNFTTCARVREGGGGAEG